MIIVMCRLQRCLNITCAALFDKMGPVDSQFMVNGLKSILWHESKLS